MAKDERVLTFFQHLEELRLRLIISIVSLVIGTIVGYILSSHVLNFLTLPLKNVPDKYEKEPFRLILKNGQFLYSSKPFAGLFPVGWSVCHAVCACLIVK